MCRRETAWESRYCRNAKRSPFVCVLVWVYFEHERFESGFRDLTLCVKVLRPGLMPLAVLSCFGSSCFFCFCLVLCLLCLFLFLVGPSDLIWH